MVDPSGITRRDFMRVGLAAAASSTVSCASIAAPPRAPTAQLDATALADLVRRGEVTAAELLESAIARANALNPRINAIVAEHFELARRAARSSLPEGPLRGVPFLLKDLGIAMKGTVTTEGSRLFRDQVFDYDDSLVKRYRAAGLVVFGKTHSPEFGGSPSSESAIFGVTRNPWDLSRSAGGSSGGAAAAVAAGIVPVAHASDGGGSIRIPASSCGLFGMKPSRGRLPSGPVVYEGWGGLSTDHVVSRTVRDSALFLDATQGPDIGDAYATVPRDRPFVEEAKPRHRTRLRIALMTRSALPVEVHPECRKAAEEAGKLCESLGHIVEPVAPPPLDVETLWTAYGATVSVGIASVVGAREQKLGRKAGAEDLEPISRISVESGRKVGGIEHARARDALHAASRVLGRFMQEYDVILSPTMAAIPPKLGRLSLSQPYEDFIGPASAASAFTSLFNMTGQPAMSVPLHWTAANLPVGVMFAGRLGDEATLFRLAFELEAARPWRQRVAPL